MSNKYQTRLDKLEKSIQIQLITEGECLMKISEYIYQVVLIDNDLVLIEPTTATYSDTCKKVV